MLSRLLVFLFFLVLVNQGRAADNDDIYLDFVPNPIVLGAPFEFIIVDASKQLKEDCGVHFSLSSTGQPFRIIDLSAERPSFLRDANWNFTATSSRFKAVAHACRTVTLGANLQCADASNPRGETWSQFGRPATTSLISGASLTVSVDATRADDKVSLLLKVANKLATSPIRDVKCNVTGFTKDPSEVSPLPMYTVDTEWNSINCTFGDFVLQRSESLTIKFGDDSAPAGTKLSVSCEGHVGPLTCPGLATAETTVPPKGLQLHVPADVKAGDNFAITATFGPNPAPKCTLTLPSDKFHLAKDSMKDCTQKNKTLSIYECIVSGAEWKPSVHVDASAPAATASINIVCGALKADATIEVKTSASLREVKLGFLNMASKQLNVSVFINNTGPSDLASVNCDLTYPVELAVDPIKAASCTPDSVSNTTSCPIALGPIPGKNEAGIVPVYRKDYLFPLPSDFFDAVKIFKISCAGQPKMEYRFNITKASDIPSTKTDSGKDDKTVKQPDSYFWTYTIVIINLFLIALVVFIGMWWRNRAIARSMAGAERVDRFNEMEMFSSDHRPLSKAE